MFANKTASVQQQLPTGPSAGLDLPFDYHRAHPTTDEPSLTGTTTGSRLDPYQQASLYPQQHNLPYNLPAQPSPRTTAAQHQQINSAGGRLDLRNLLLAPPAIAAGRGLRDGRGSISAPATPVDDSSSLAAAAVAAAVVPLNFNVSSSGGGGGGGGGGKNSSSGGGIGKFMMKKVNSSGGGVSAQYDCVLRDLIHPAHADALKAHSALAMKLLKTGKTATSLSLSISKLKKYKWSLYAGWNTPSNQLFCPVDREFQGTNQIDRALPSARKLLSVIARRLALPIGA